MDTLLGRSTNRAEKPRLAPRMRRRLLVGSSGRMTCVSTAEGGLVCNDSGKLPAPSSPEPVLRESGSA